MDGAFHVGVNLQIRPESFRFFFFFFFFFISFIFDSVNSKALICIRKPNSWKDSIKGRFCDGVILLYQISSGFYFLA